MNILYADDDQLSLQIVWRALQARGHQVITVNSSQASTMLNQFLKILTQGPMPELVILDGHNLTRDTTGQPVLDIPPSMVMNWLTGHGLPAHTPFVLYSSDDQLVGQARQDAGLGFQAAVSKGGNEGGLAALLRVIEGQS